jgi:O-antigen/teichoic acid export membrane protein
MSRTASAPGAPPGGALHGFFRKNALIGVAEIAGRLPLIFIAGYVARKLGPDTYGNWALVIAYAGLLGSMVTFGLPISISRLASVTSAGAARGYLQLAVGRAALGFAVVAIVTLAARPWIADLLGISSDHAWLLPLGCLVVTISGVEALLDAYFKSREQVGRQSASVLARSSIEVVSIFFGFSGLVSIPGLSKTTESLLLYLALSFVLKSCAYSLLVLVRAPRLQQPEREERRTFLSYGLPMIPAALVVFLTIQGDRLALGHLFDKDALGIYAFAAALAAYVGVLGYIINPLLLPRASKLYDGGDHEGVNRLFARSQQVYFVLYALVVTVLVLFSGEVIDLTAGDKYRNSAAVLVILAAAVGLEGLLGIFQWIFQLARRPALVLWFNVGYMLLNIAGVLVGAWLGGPAAVALGVLVTTVLANAIRYALARQLLPIRLEPAVAAGLVGLTVLSLLAWYGARPWSLGARAGVESALVLICAAAIAVVLRRRGFWPAKSAPAGSSAAT